jgi:hypothetical protein
MLLSKGDSGIASSTTASPFPMPPPQGRHQSSTWDDDSWAFSPPSLPPPSLSPSWRSSRVRQQPTAGPQHRRMRIRRLSTRSTLGRATSIGQCPCRQHWRWGGTRPGLAHCTPVPARLLPCRGSGQPRPAHLLQSAFGISWGHALVASFRALWLGMARAARSVELEMAMWATARHRGLKAWLQRSGVAYVILRRPGLVPSVLDLHA